MVLLILVDGRSRFDGRGVKYNEKSPREEIKYYFAFICYFPLPNDKFCLCYYSSRKVHEITEVFNDNEQENANRAAPNYFFNREKSFVDADSFTKRQQWDSLGVGDLKLKHLPS